jgi:hypothetical protein
LKELHPTANKAEIEEAFIAQCNFPKHRSVYVGDGFCLRFSEANKPSFSNSVLSLSALKKHDAFPVVICVVRPDRLDFRLANTTFLRRISHSSHTLREDNIRGTFLGHDIMDEYEGIPNRPERFEELLAIHSAFNWEENIGRLVEATNAIIARSTRFDVTKEALECLLEAPQRSTTACETASYAEAERKLSSVIELRAGELLRTAATDNVNLRGNTIEQIITGEVNAHRLDDLIFALENGGQLIVDIKTKLLDRASAPKAYNIDKMLALLAQPGSVVCFFFVGLDVATHTVRTRLISIFDPIIIVATQIRTHWAGRASRGVTQLSGDLTRIFSPDYRPSVDIDGGVKLLRLFVER